ncbi:hypothetical protein RIN67_02975 [Levilactobacillus namurensis]|uniref:hypothetical protein n=1 Tax=Levilactobacillus namurensis TaxID=380393 RepID=UPI00046432E6|nr:hypothetical protein [Levilactobacillus namurensis]MDT7019328.1 hypothetical protein [Levilactobacillus namurensis]WNN66072.1 hypothetical protein RIN67_02975 [Levilactobacillus namurensis]
MKIEIDLDTVLTKVADRMQASELVPEEFKDQLIHDVVRVAKDQAERDPEKWANAMAGDIADMTIRKMLQECGPLLGFLRAASH